MKLSLVPALVTNRLFGVAWAILIALLLVLAIDSFIAKPGGDSAIFMYVAQGILEGEVPYLDRWDHKGPLLYLINAVGLLIEETWGIWIVQALFLLGTIYFALILLRKAFGTTPTLFALALFLILFSRFNPPGNYTEQYALLFQFLALYLLFRSHQQPHREFRLIHFALLHMTIGALGAASFLLRPDLAALWIAIGIYWLLLRGTAFRKLGWAALGGGCALLSVAALFGTFGAFGALWDAVIVYNFAYSDASLPERLASVRYLSTETLFASLLTLAGWVIGALCLITSRVQGDHRRAVVATALILLPLQIVSISLPGYGWPHYYLAALPAATVLLALVMWFVLEQERIFLKLLIVALLIGTAYASLPHANFARLSGKYADNALYAENNLSRLADRIRGITEPNDRILVWGRGPALYLLSDRDAPTRFFYHFPLIKPNYANQSLREEFVSDIKEKKPKLIIDMRYPGFPPLDSDASHDWPQDHRYLHDPSEFEPLFDLVEEDYIVFGRFAHYTVYKLRSDEMIVEASITGELIIRSTFDVYFDGRTLIYVNDACSQADVDRRFILHVVPVDKAVIGGDAHHNMDFSFAEGDDWQLRKGCAVSRELPEYAIASIRTGQYSASGSRHVWIGEYTFSPSK